MSAGLRQVKDPYKEGGKDSRVQRLVGCSDDAVGSRVSAGSWRAVVVMGSDEGGRNAIAQRLIGCCVALS
jgi:hypothetical protein